MSYFIHEQIVLSRSPEGPLAAHLASFANFVGEQGYSAFSLKRHVRIAVGFSRWLGQIGIQGHSICSAHGVEYLRDRARHLRPGRGDSAVLQHLITFLRHEGLTPQEEVEPARLSAVEQCVQDYAQYLCEARGLATATIINYVPFVRDFLKRQFDEDPVTLSRLGAGDVVEFVQHQVPRLHLKRAKLMTTALRSFLRYARYRGDITLDLAAAVPVVANWSMTSIPRAIGAAQVRQLLDSIDRDRPTGRRDYAILLLLARLGVRSGEVAFLELDDIDWNTGQIHVRGKRGQRYELPLPVEVGEAIAAYLQAGRPPSASRRVFLRARAPNRGFQGACGVCSLVRHSLERAGIHTPTRGAHQFRHGLASEMLRQGASLGEIGELLGHRHPQTTTIYTKVDIAALRTLALPWPGGVR